MDSDQTWTPSRSITGVVILVKHDDKSVLKSDINRTVLVHCASLCAATITLILNPLLATPIALIVAYLLANSTGSIIGLTYLSLNCMMDESVKSVHQCVNMKLGMNIGLVICYSMLFIQSMKFI